MPKNIVICCDGTNNQFGTRNTNIVRLFQCLDRSPEAEQVAFYDAGIGTLALPGWRTKVMKKLSSWWDLAFAAALMRNVEDAIRFLMVHYEPGDQIYMFGFSRGAYTVRVVAGLLYKCGLPPRGNDSIWPYFVQQYKRRGRDQLHRDFQETFGVPCPVRFLGVWDTVSTVGYVWDPQTFDYTFFNDGVTFVRHAMAVDERRGFFRTNRWRRDDDLGENGIPKWKQYFFPGVHSDVGGGYTDGALWKAPLQWIAAEAEECGLKFAPGRLVKILAAEPAKLWHTTLQHESLSIGWRLAGFVPKQKQREKPDGDWETYYRLAWPKRRQIFSGEMLHRTVIERWRDVPEYRPPNLDEEIMAALVGRLTPDDVALPYEK